MRDSDTSFYVTGGTLRPDAPSYVERQADRDLTEGLLQGEFCYVLTSRQMGKSSLMVRTANKLREKGVQAVVLDLTAIGQNLTPEQWYDGLTLVLGRPLRLEDTLEEYWLSNPRYSPVQRFFSAIRDVVLSKFDKPLAIFVDEIDVVRSLPFASDEFFAAIRQCYNRRSEDPAFNRLTFCLLGIATPPELIRDSRTTPFNIGRRIALRDFAREEAAPLAQSLAQDKALATDLLNRIFYWTHGHPYLTQRLCRAAAEANASSQAGSPRIQNPQSIDRLCEDLFLSNRAREHDDNLLFVREWLLRGDADLAAVLNLYDRIRNFEGVRDDELNPLIKVLHLSGIVREEQGLLKVRNRIYERVFDRDWVKANMPVLGQSRAAAIAVLPFMDRSADPLNEYWTDGLTEELINALGQVRGLTVASRSSAFRFKGKSENLREIATVLKVEVVLVGAVQRLGDRVRISAELVSVPDGYRLWSDTFNYRAEDLMEIQDEITAAIVARLRYGLQARPEKFEIRTPTENLEAYNLYLRGRYYWNKRQEEPVRRSIEFFEQAIQKDPRFAMAYAALADAYSIMGVYSYAAPGLAYPKAKTAALKALEIDERVAQVHAALGCVASIHEWNWGLAETEFKRAIELNPSYATAHQWYAVNCLTPLGRHQESIGELRKAQAVDPLSLGIQVSLALAFFYARDYDQAIGQCRLTMDMEENFWVTHMFLGWAYLQKSMLQEAIHACEEAVRLGKNDPVPTATLGYAHALAGQRNEAIQLAEKLEGLCQERYVPASEIGILWLGLGDPSKAMDWLLKAAEERSLRLIYLQVEPRLDKLRSEPRFQELVKRVGLLQKPERS